MFINNQLIIGVLSNDLMLCIIKHVCGIEGAFHVKWAFEQDSYAWNASMGKRQFAPLGP